MGAAREADSFLARRAARLGVCLVLWLATGAYLLPFVDRGWIAHDDGMLGQAAERVMAGELPHRDFYDPSGKAASRICMRSDSRFLVSGWYPFGGCFLPRRSHGCRLSLLRRVSFPQ